MSQKKQISYKNIMSYMTKSNPFISFPKSMTLTNIKKSTKKPLSKKKKKCNVH